MTRAPDLHHRADQLNAALEKATPSEIITLILTQYSRENLAVVSSFGTESAVLLHLVAQVDPAVPVVFIDPGMLFPETLAYQQELADRLGLREVRRIGPDPAGLAAADPDQSLWYSDPDACCALRKVAPLAGALAGVDLWINGRKSYQAATRQAMPLVEVDGGRLKLNLLRDWDQAALAAYFERHDLPRHPMEAKGFPSIGCLPCTSRVAPGEDSRAGRWRGRGKIECGIHVS